MSIEKEIDDLCRELDAADTVGKAHTVAMKAIRKWEESAKSPATGQPLSELTIRREGDSVIVGTPAGNFVLPIPATEQPDDKPKRYSIGRDPASFGNIYCDGELLIRYGETGIDKRVIEFVDAANRVPEREFSESEKLLAWIFKLYANNNLSFADNWYAEAEDLFNNRRRGRDNG